MSLNRYDCYTVKLLNRYDSYTVKSLFCNNCYHITTLSYYDIVIDYYLSKL